MIFQAILFCVIFLTLFGVSLWPVLFKNHAGKNKIFIITNILAVFLAGAAGAKLFYAKNNAAAREQNMTVALKEVSVRLANPEPGPMVIPEAVAEDERNMENILRKADDFCARMKPDENAKGAEK